MWKLFGLFLLCNCSGERIAHIFLNAGQSNSEGFNSDGHTSEDVSYANILQLDCCANGVMLPPEQCKLIIAQDPLHHQCDTKWLTGITVGYGMSFARAFGEEMPEDDLIIIVPAGISGSGFYDHTWTAYDGTGFVAAAKKVQQAYDLILKDYQEYTPRFEAIIWQHGTHDAGNNAGHFTADSTFYLYQDILPMIAAFRDKSAIPCTYPELPFLCANLLPAWAFDPRRPGRLGVLVANALVDQLVPYASCASSYGLEGDPAYLDKRPPGDFLHFTAASQRLLGKRYYAAYKMAKLNHPPVSES